MSPLMAKKPAETDVDNYRHDKAKCLNIPTAENQALVPDDEKALKVLRYPRNPDLDPQLVWRGKDSEDGAPLEIAAPPIYIQEKIHPRALIEDLRRQSARRKNQRAEQTDLFHDFNGLPVGWVEDAAANYYYDEGRWQNRMILGDSLLVMGSLADREALRGKVQCIYFDPPYGIKFNSNWQPRISLPVQGVTADFAQVVYDNLLASGVQNTKKGEAINFEWLKPRVSRSGLVPFEGRYSEGGDLKRAAICIGPEYDTVGYDLVGKAAREAADLFDTLIVCGFAFAPEIDESRLNFGAHRV